MALFLDDQESKIYQELIKNFFQNDGEKFLIVQLRNSSGMPVS